MQRRRSSICSSRARSRLPKEYFSLQFARRCVFTQPRPISDIGGLPRNGNATRPGCCRNRPRRYYGSGLATGEDILLDDRVNAPISINHLGDAEVDANRN